MTTPIYYIKNGNLNFADKTILSDLELYIHRGNKICLIGRNGCGKSSLMKVISGNYELDSGELFHDSSTTIDYLHQEVKTNLNISIYDFILDQFAENNVDQYKIDIILEKLHLDKNSNLSDCSGGQIRRASLAKALVSEPDILLLDEPTNHLDISTIEWLEDFVKSYAGAIICVSHDRTFLTNVTNKIWWLDRDNLRKSDKGFKYFEEWQGLVIEQEEAILRKLNKKLDIENDWLQTGVTARRKRNQKRLADLKNLREIARGQANKLALSKQKVQIDHSNDVSKSKFIVELDNISFNYPQRKIINNFSFRVTKGERIGIIGSNGSGKTTLIKLITKQIEPNSGRVTHGAKLDISYFDQHRTELNPNHSLQQILCPTGGDQIFLPNKTMHAAGYLKQFMFDPKLLTAKVSTLSGGEASRLLLAKTLINPGNLLILDEPTNDLDMDSLEVLLDILADYSGTLLLISHDRDFLNRLVTRTLIFADNKITDITGSYEDYRQLATSKTVTNNKPQTNKPTTLLTPKKEETKAKKLSYKDQRLLEVLPVEIDKLEQQIKNLELILSDSSLYLSDPAKFNKTSNDLSDCKKKLDDLLTQWLEIS
ncbi:MAG: ABC-F family ATP-binding cassette domain-containing protein [Candidatus Rickettsia vulgarisii]